MKHIRILPLLLSFAAVLSLSACGQQPADPVRSTPTSSSSQTAPEQTAEGILTAEELTLLESLYGTPKDEAVSALNLTLTKNTGSQFTMLAVDEPREMVGQQFLTFVRCVASNPKTYDTLYGVEYTARIGNSENKGVRAAQELYAALTAAYGAPVTPANTENRIADYLEELTAAGNLSEDWKAGDHTTVTLRILPDGENAVALRLIYQITVDPDRALWRDNDQPDSFVDNGLGEGYSKQLPLEEMNLSQYLTYAVSQSLPLEEDPYVFQITLPCDLHYYAHKEDAEPAVVLTEGTLVDLGEGPLGQMGYGLFSFPDYEKGWRYAAPFVEAGQEICQLTEAEHYYVKLDELTAVAKTCFAVNAEKIEQRENQNWDREPWQERICHDADQYAEWLTLELDRTFLRKGVFCSPEFE